jgi:hypothetical protein
MRTVAKKGVFVLLDTNRGWELSLADEDGRKGKVWLTEGWVGVQNGKEVERIGRRLIIRGFEPFVKKISNYLTFLERDSQWRDVYVCWEGLQHIIDILIMRVVADFEVLNVRKK